MLFKIGGAIVKIAKIIVQFITVKSHLVGLTLIMTMNIV